MRDWGESELAIWNANPRPTPAMIWYPTHFPVLEVDMRVLIKPVPMDVSIVPVMMNGK
jgi:hypothetical protein